ncbi:MAG TPA: carboxymuconolactone decarboxylase family protein [Usitatibacter sp.]|nr:carboxymuconolactone decarboxylase family protein [Usitatibacter sp.]
MPAVDFAFIPGFLPALQRSPAALEARSKLARTIGEGKLLPRQRAQIALVVAQESQCDYCVWAQTCVARQAGLGWEDIAFACAGTALDARDAAIVKLARVIAKTGCFSPNEVRALARDPLLRPSDVTEIVANAALAVLDNYMIQSLAPAESRTGTRRAA